MAKNFLRQVGFVYPDGHRHRRYIACSKNPPERLSENPPEGMLEDLPEGLSDSLSDRLSDNICRPAV